MPIQENAKKCTILLVCNILHLLVSSGLLTISAWIRMQCHSTTGRIPLKLRNILRQNMTLSVTVLRLCQLRWRISSEGTNIG
jgi:hypothetical protein